MRRPVSMSGRVLVAIGGRVKDIVAMVLDCSSLLCRCGKNSLPLHRDWLNGCCDWDENTSVIYAGDSIVVVVADAAAFRKGCCLSCKGIFLFQFTTISTHIADFSRKRCYLSSSDVLLFLFQPLQAFAFGAKALMELLTHRAARGAENVPTSPAMMSPTQQLKRLRAA